MVAIATPQPRVFRRTTTARVVNFFARMMLKHFGERVTRVDIDGRTYRVGTSEEGGRIEVITRLESSRQ